MHPGAEKKMPDGPGKVQASSSLCLRINPFYHVQIEQCETKHIEFCETEAVRKCVPTVERQCRTEDFQECWEEDEEDCK